MKLIVLWGNEVTCVNEAPLFVDLHNPEGVVPDVPAKSIEPKFGSTASRSPAPRPTSFPPTLKFTGLIVHVLPLSLEAITAPLPAHDCVYLPQSR